jgi:cytochrome P450 family 109
VSEPQRPFTLFDSPEMAGDPFPILAGLRQEAPVFRPPGGPLWMVSQYADAVRIFHDPTTFSSSVGQRAEGETRPPTILFDDPPVHTRMRGLLTGAFTPRVIELQRPAIEANCRAMVDRMLAGETADFVAGIAYPLPVMVIAAMLGVQDGDMATFKRWSDAIIANVATSLFESNNTALEEINAEFDAYFSMQLDKLRASPEDNLLSALVHAETKDGGRLSQSDLLVICRVLLVAGNETTTGLIVNCARVFTRFPEVLGQLKERPELIPSMIEETLRYYPPFPATFRRTTRDVEVHGVTIPKDDRLLVLIASANHDERAFDRAEEFVIDRDPNRHLGFGQGIHYCLGAPLARLETQIVLNTLLPRIKSLRIEGDAGAVLVPGGPKELQVRFEFDHAFAMA